MSFTDVYLDHSAVREIRNTVMTIRAIGGNFDAMRQVKPSLFDLACTYVHLGAHSYTIIGDYIFLYEDGVPQHCFHTTNDSSELFKAFKLMCDHSSVHTEETIDLYEGLTVTSHYAARCVVPSARVALAAE